MNEKFVKCFIEAFKEMIDHDIEELILLYGNNEDKIFETLLTADLMHQNNATNAT